MDEAHPLSFSIVVWLLEVKNNQFCPCENNEALLGPKVSYLSASGTLMYLSNCTHTYFVFSNNLLARHSFFQLKNIIIVSNIYHAIFGEQLIQIYFI